MRTWILACCCAVLSSSAWADIGIDAKAGTLGGGVQISKGFGEKVTIGLAVNAFSDDRTETIEGVDYKADLQLATAGLLLNYHPFAGPFRLTMGVYANDNELELTGQPNGTYTINDTTYAAGTVGELKGRLSFDSTAPYIGLGWGSRPGSRFGFTLDVGALYQGSPNVSLTASGAAANPALAADIERERQQLESKLDYEWYPVVALGVYARF